MTFERVRHCECGAIVRADGHRICRRCLALTNHAPRAVVASVLARERRHTLPAPKHLPTSIYVQHDPVKARYQWAQAVSR